MLVIRKATEADIEPIFNIYDQHVLTGIATFETTVKSPTEKLDWFLAHQGDHKLLVAELNRKVVGWAGFSKWSPREAYARAAELSIYIEDSVQGQGVGKKLLTEILNQPSNIQVLIARIAEPNPASVALHQAVGFKDIGIMKQIGEKFGKLIDVRLMDWHRPPK